MPPLFDATHSLAERVRQRRVDAGEPLASVIADEVALYVSDGKDVSAEPLSQSLKDELVGLGPLQQFLDDPGVEEIWINSPENVFVARAGVSERVQVSLTSESIRGLVERMLRPTGRRIDMSQPFVDASLPDGSRLHVAIPDITRQHWSVNIRKFAARLRSLEDLAGAGAMSADASRYLAELVREGASVLVSGATQAGKTTLLNALLDAVPAHERIVTVEETFELSLHRDDHVGLQCRGPSLEGTGEITLRRLVKEALRMRPDRLVVGEVRGAEALDLLIALNSGLPGMCSIHAKSAQQALVKLSTLPLLEGRNVDASFVLPTVAGTIDAVVHLERSPEGTRRLVSIIAPTGRITKGVIESRVIFEAREGTLVRYDQSERPA
jgi:pilus assembly protein CpaF